MKFQFRHLRPSETDYELIGAGVLITSGLLLLLWLKMALPIPHCWFRACTGIPCATCGATHSLAALINQNWISAVQWNPLCFVAVIAAGVFTLYAMTVVIFRLPRLRITAVDNTTALVLRILAVAIFLGNWIYLIATQAHRP
ncbi:MAG: DUF2752 domain-containing protein [Chthoniobacterales bacterium]